ncbi:hypothetical protein [Paenarthrobacter aurescens]|uniref:Uncharacterized protein n=1 Tax=Paenarthrobacter aurescens TaxID=43663 RepID=A0A4Y3NEF0_PAEAU|nr:hypothetical protein [Paenarthrobacter aurescens]MDO6144892.1 hypothetical protein [Paenarthrobacter aurescens]MDO6148737.1 hypothetical protein [Paenarthrobacter aurescens]MDO6159983.1 hypothetical protein [Paenarthrobacter aurescens]MDO6163842.1 hypothetical protein [Paenarthrobacter aurescens]GEB17448.1 hypothetical protein AAU01_02030 [Paenarthrobacter aurescens]
MEQRFVRYQSTTPDAKGRHLGIFALANRLAKEGSLSPEDWRQWRSANDFYGEAYVTPGASFYAAPGAQAWFKLTAAHLVGRIDFYTDLLRRHDVPCSAVYSSDPGVVLYEDDVQVVVVPYKRCAYESD